jgi:hypothetical protein
VAGASTAFALANAEPERRQRLLQLTSRLQNGLRSLKFDIGPSVTPITPLWFGEESLALRWMQSLRELGLFVKAWLHPSESRLLLSPCALMEDAHIDRILDIVSVPLKRLGAPTTSLPSSGAVATPGSFAAANASEAHWHPQRIPEETAPELGRFGAVLDSLETLTWRLSNARSTRIKRLIDVAWLRDVLDKARRQ